MAWRDRIKEFRRVPVGQLRPNPKNPALHGVEQREALRGALAEIGYIDALIARELPDGMLELIDGHLRADLSPDQEVPVLIVDLNDAEADAALASHDPLGRLAERDDTLYAGLLGEIEALDADFRRFLAQEKPSDVAAGADGTDAGQDKNGPQEMELRPHEHYDYVIALARTTHEWNRLCELLKLEPVVIGRGKLRKVGIGRGIEAKKLIDILESKDGGVPDSRPE